MTRVSPSIAVRPIGAEDHLGFLQDRGAASFLQTPAWGRVKTDWAHESLGWYAADVPDTLLGVGLALYRRLPRLRRVLAYLPEGPVLDWSRPDVDAHLLALREHVRGRGAFALRVGPPVAVHRWRAGTVKDAIAAPALRSLAQVPADVTDADGLTVVQTLRRLGFRRLAADAGFAAGQPQYVFQVPLAGRDEAALLAGMNQLWRRNVKKAAKAGVLVEVGGPGDLADFHRLYRQTAARDHFVPRPLEYFQRMFAVMTQEDPTRIRLYLARHDGDLVAATTWVRVGRHTWYSYGASSTAKREVQGSTAIQWRMMRDALAAGADVYDLRGITDTVASDDPHLGLVRFKVGTGGEAVEYVGEWDLPLNRPLYRAFALYLRRRG